MIRVAVPSQLIAYTDGRTRVEARGRTVGEVMDDLDRMFPGLKFRVIDEQRRIRRHMRIFVGQTEARTPDAPIADGGELLIFGALSGG
jgi:molybdopterin synthase sulfur carrier subunit